MIIATHSGEAHADDVFGVAVLKTLYPESIVLRTRDMAQIADADFAVDVGGEWAPAKGRFDHHQKDFAGAREDGTAYASAGLVWAEHGLAYVQAVTPNLPESLARQVVADLDESLVSHIDRADTGAAAGAPGLFGISALIAQTNLTWKEEHGVDASTRETARYQNFELAVSLTNTLLRRAVAHSAADLEGLDLVRKAQTIKNGKVLILDTPGLDWTRVACLEMPDVLFVIFPESTDNHHMLRTVPQELGSFKARADLPKSWAGLRWADLAAVTGVPESVFCHNGRFIAGATSKAAAVRLAELALRDFEQT